MPGFRQKKHIISFILVLLPFLGKSQESIVGLSGNFVFNTNSEETNPAIVGFSDLYSFNTINQFDERLESLSDLFDFNTFQSEPKSLVGLSGIFNFNTIDQFDERLEGLSDPFAFNTLQPDLESLVGFSGFFSFNTTDQFDERLEGLSDLFSFNTLQSETESLIGFSALFSFNTIDQFDERLEGLSELFNFNTLNPEPESLVGFSVIFTFNTIQNVPSPLLGIYGFFYFNTLDDALPVEWLSFDATAMDRSIKLQWKTASEINNDFFTILRSADGYNFEPLVFMNGAGTTSGLSEYDWTDINPLPGINYYRLKQTDFDGTTDYSHIVAASILLLEPAKIYVFKNQLHILLPLDFEKEFKITLFDPLGRIVKSDTFSHSPGLTYIMNLYNLKDELLFVNIIGDNHIYSEKVLNIRR